jgi:lipoate---protein ligase
MHFEVLITPAASPSENMQMDIKLLKDLAYNERVILHFYRWEGCCATYGHFIDPYQFLNKEKVDLHHLRLARRPTGGGIIFHHCDLAFSVLIPAKHPGYSLNTLKNYALINALVIQAIKSFTRDKIEPSLLQEESISLGESSDNFCMAKSTIYDVMLDGRKVGGAAQRRTKFGLLHQGTIALSLPYDLISKNIIIGGERIISAMCRNGYALIKGQASFNEFEESRRFLQFLLIKAMQSLI